MSQSGRSKKRPANDDGPRLPKRVWAVIRKVRAGQTLCRYHHHKQTGTPSEIFFFEPGGMACSPKSALAAINSGLLKPNNDGLFGGDVSQTWSAI